MSAAGCVYATLLHSGAVKIGMGRDVARASDGKTYGPVTVLAIWPVTDRRSAERAAHSACAKWHVPAEGRELFRCKPAEIIKTIGEAVSSFQVPAPEKPSARDAEAAAEWIVQECEERVVSNSTPGASCL